MGVRAVAGTYVVVGLSVAYFSLYVLALYPATLQQLQMIKESGPHLPEQGQMDCAATAAEDTETRPDAVVLMLLGAALALLAMATVGATNLLYTFPALFLTPITARVNLAYLAGVVHHAIGDCHGHGSFHQLLLAGYVTIIGLLGVAGAGLLLTLLGIGVALRGRV